MASSQSTAAQAAPQLNESSPVEYRDVPGFPDYRVGSDGSVWSKRVSARWGQPPRWTKINGSLADHGYVKVSLFVDGQGKVDKYVHQLVLEAFVGPCPEGMEACHDPDRTRTNNTLSNLRWDTRKGNIADKVTHGTQPFGEDVHCAKLTESQVAEARERYAAGDVTMQAIADDLGVNQITAFDFIRGKTWPHAGGPIQAGCLRPKKLTAPEVLEIRKLFRETGDKWIAVERFGVSEATVRDIVNNRTWTHLKGEA